MSVRESVRTAFLSVCLLILLPAVALCGWHTEKAIEWILAHQSENCAWGSEGDNPHQALRCLNLAGQFDEKFRKAYLRLRHLQALNGSWYNGVDSTSLSIWALMEAGDDPDAGYIKRAVAWLKDRQKDDGHWGTDLPARRTAMACIALTLACSTTDTAVLQGVQWLKDAQNSDGGWGLSPGGSSTGGGHAYYPAVALILAEGKEAPATLKALNWWRDYGASNPVWHVSKLMPFAYAGLYSDAASFAPNVVACQIADGGWPEAYGWPSRSATTARAVIALLKAKDLGVSGLDDATSHGLAWINQHINEEGGFIGTYESPAATAWALSALSLVYPYDFAPIDCAVQLYLSIGTGWAWTFYHRPPYDYETDDTGLTAFALQQTQHPAVNSLVQNAAQRILDAQNPDGGWCVHATGCDSDHVHSVYALLGLAASGLGPEDSAFEQGVNWVLDQLSTGSLGSNFFNGLFAYVLDETEATTPQLAIIREHLLTSQESDGGWFEEPTDKFSATNATAMAIVGLGEEPAHRQEVIKGRRWLQATQHADGGWAPLPGASWIDSLTGATGYACWALLKTEDLEVTPTLKLKFNRDDYLPGDSVQLQVTSPETINWLTGQVQLPDASQQPLALSRIDGSAFSSEFQLAGDAPPGALLVSVEGETTQGFNAQVGTTAVEPEYQTESWDYSFCYDNERWATAGFPSLHTVPSFFWETERVGMSSSDNNTFGCWNTPEPYLLTMLPQNLYRLRFQVSSNLTDPSLVPEFRLRMNQDNFQNSSCYIVTSSGSGDNSPTGTPRTYEMYVVPIQGVNPEPVDAEVMMAFDMINLNTGDEPQSTLYLEDLEVERMPLAYVDHEFESVISYDFTQGTYGWQFDSVSQHTAPTAQVTAEGLKLTAQDNTNTFGYWYSPTISVEPDSLYRLRCQLSTDVADRSLTPAIRLRVNSAYFQSAATFIIQSMGAGENAPQAGEKKSYDLYFLPDENASTHGMIVSFDMINIGLGDAPEGTLILTSLSLKRAVHPLF